MQIVSSWDNLYKMSKPEETIFMKWQSLCSGKNKKKNIINLSTAEFAQRMVMIKVHRQPNLIGYRSSIIKTSRSFVSFWDFVLQILTPELVKNNSGCSVEELCLIVGLGWLSSVILPLHQSRSGLFSEMPNCRKRFPWISVRCDGC